MEPGPGTRLFSFALVYLETSNSPPMLTFPPRKSQPSAFKAFSNLDAPQLPHSQHTFYCYPILADLIC